MSIRIKLTLHIIALWAVLYTIFHFYWLPTFSEEDVSRYRIAQEQVLGLLSITLLEALSRDDLAQVYRTLDNVMLARKDWRTLTVIDNKGLILYPLVTATISDSQKLEHINWIQRQGGKTFVEFRLLADPQSFLAAQALNVSQLQWLFFVLFIISLIASILVENKVVRRPINALIVAIARLGDRDFSTRLPFASNDEIGKLVAAFEEMRDRTRIYQDQLKLARDKALEATLTRDEALEATRAKSEFLAKMSHEFRTPLNAIIGYSEIVSEEAVDHGHSIYVPDIDRIKNAANHLLSLINDILDLSKIEAGKTELHLHKINLPDFLTEVVDTLKPIATHAKNTIEIDIRTTQTSAHADPTKLRQLVYNLLSNANKFTQEGIITVSLKSNTVDNINFYVIEVKDTGVGIEKHQLARIFAPFVQADDSYSRKHEGIGLGLSLCKQICGLMGGSIEVKSIEGLGSTFTIQLPVTPKDINSSTESEGDIATTEDQARQYVSSS